MLVKAFDKQKYSNQLKYYHVIRGLNFRKILTSRQFKLHKLAML